MGNSPLQLDRDDFVFQMFDALLPRAAGMASAEDYYIRDEPTRAARLAVFALDAAVKS